MKLIKKIVIFLVISLWPLTLFKQTKFPEAFLFSIPALILFASYKLSLRKNKLYFYPILLIPVITPKLAMFPIVFYILQSTASRFKNVKLLPLFLSFVIFLISWNSFKGQSIFTRDYEAQQKIIRDSQLYTSILTARFFHNKARIFTDKLTDNLFILTDPNNYFFGNHPRQVSGNQNLAKFPFLSFVFLSYAFFFFKNFKFKEFIIVSTLTSVFVLSILTVFDKNDFILWTPMSVLMLFGMGMFEQKFKYSNTFLWLCIIFFLIEFLRILVI